MIKSSIEQLRLQKDRSGSWGNLNPYRMNAVFKYAGNSILDAGCSSGKYVDTLRSRGYQTFGVDLLEDGNWWSRSPSSFVQSNVVQLPFANKSVDTILAFEILEHIDEIECVLEEFQRIARKNIILSVPNCQQPEVFSKSGLGFYHWIDRTHRNFYYRDSFDELLRRKNLSTQHFEYINPIRPETLFLTSWHVPLKLAHFFGSAISRIPIKHQYFMTLLFVVSVD